MSLFEALAAFAKTQSVWVYLFIFFGKLLEVTTSTLRLVLINRGIRAVGSMIAVLEITLWLIITSTVLSGFQSDPLKIVVYALAFGLGNFMGSWLDEKLAFGLSSIQVVVPDEGSAHTLCDALRGKGYGITSLDVRGMDDQKHYMMLMMIRRKFLNEALDLIAKTSEKAVITVSDVKVQKGGYMRMPAGRHFSLHNKVPPKNYK
ncbi:MAG: DUF5698 domain-containing protein [Bacillota bacterium]